MKKKIFSLILILVMICSLTGCVKYNATMEIRKDKTMTFSIIYAMANSVLEMSDDKETAILDAAQKQSLINQGFTITDYKDEKNTGVTISKEYPNIDDVSSELDVEYSLSKMFEETSESKLFKVVKGKDKNTYYAKFNFNSSDANEETDAQDSNEQDNNEDASKLGEAVASSFDMKFMVKLPYASISNNATEKSEDGKELTWVLNTGKTETIEFQFELDNLKKETTNVISNNSNNKAPNSFTARFFNKANMPVIIGAGVIFGIAVIFVVALYIKANKEIKKQTNKKETKGKSATITTPVEQVVETKPVEQTSTITSTEPMVEVKPVETTPIVAPVEMTNQAVSVEPTPVASAEPTIEVKPVEITPTVAPVETTNQAVSVEPTPVASTEPTIEVKPVEIVPTIEPVVSNEQSSSENDII